MMPIKTSELTGQKLDLIVHDLLHPDEPIKEGCTAPPYSSDWSFGGPIIEREYMYLEYSGIWRSYCTQNGNSFMSVGETPLIAAMLCFVESKLGEEIDVSEEMA